MSMQLIRLLHLMSDAPIHTTGEVLEVRSDVLYRVSLLNGKVILAHLSKELKTEGVAFAVGHTLLLEMTPYDFDGARILKSVEPEQ